MLIPHDYVIQNYLSPQHFQGLKNLRILSGMLMVLIYYGEPAYPDGLYSDSLSTHGLIITINHTHNQSRPKRD